MAANIVDGSFKEQYKRIYDYAHELLKWNLGSTIKIKVENDNDEAIFQRFYSCLKACKDSFVSCRPIIGLFNGKVGHQEKKRLQLLKETSAPRSLTYFIRKRS